MNKTTFPAANALLIFSLSDTSQHAHVKQTLRQGHNTNTFLFASIQAAHCPLPDNALTTTGLTTFQLLERLYAVVAQMNSARTIPITITSAVAVSYDSARSFGLLNEIIPNEEFTFETALQQGA